MLRGTELGRLVFLRQVPDQHPANVRANIDMARCVAHPSLLKVVGRVETPQTTFIASEYISGVALMELLENAMARGQRIDTQVAVRIIRDALLAAAQAKTLLRENTGSLVSRCIFPDTVWIAEFGETMLTEVGVAASLVEDDTEQSTNTQDDEIDDDVAAAGAELLKLLTNQPLEEAEMTLPLSGKLASIVARAVNPRASNRFKTAQEMADAMSALPPHQMATERIVGNAVETLMASVLAVRHPRRLMSVASPQRPGGQDATSVFQGSFDVAASPRESALRSMPSSGIKAPQKPASEAAPKHGSKVGSSHPAYAFLAKHGLLEQAGNLGQQQDHEHTDSVEHGKPSSSQPPVDHSDDDPTHIASERWATAHDAAIAAQPKWLPRNRSSSGELGTAQQAKRAAHWRLLFVPLLVLAALLTLWLVASTPR
jgi:hypothetical protein